MAGLLEQLRAQFPEFGDISDAQLVEWAAPAFGGDVDSTARFLGVPRNEPGFFSQVKSSLGSYPYGAGRVLEDVGLPGVGGALRRYGENVQFHNPPSEASQDFSSLGQHPWQGFKELAGQAVGSSLPAIVPYVGPVSRVLGPAGTLAAGTAAASVPAYGQIRQTQDQTGQENIPGAALGALATGAIEQVGGIQRFMRPAGGQLLANGLTTDLLKEMSTTPLRTFAKQGLRAAGEEGLEELFQQPIQQLAGGQDPTTPESLENTAFSGFGGFIGSLPFGGVAGGRLALQHAGAQRFVDQTLTNPEAPRDQRLDAVTMQQQFGGLDNAWAENMRLGIQDDHNRMRAAALAAGAPLNLLDTQNELSALEQYQPAPVQSPAGTIFDTINANHGALQGLPHQAPAMQPGTPVEDPVNRAASIYAALAGRELQPDTQEAVDFDWATQQLQQAMSPQAFAAFQAQAAMERAGQPKAARAPKAPQVQSPAPAAPQTFGAAFKAAGGRVTNVVKALDQAKSPDEALDVVRQWIEKPNIASSTLRALEELHKQISGKTYEQFLREQEAADAAQVRSNEGQVRQGGPEGQSGVQPGANQGGQNLQQLPQTLGAQAQQQGGVNARQGRSGTVVRAGNGQAAGAQPGTQVQQAGAAGERAAEPDRAESARAVSTAAQRAQLAESIVKSLRPEDQEVLGFLQQHGEKAFEPLAQKLGISRQAARQRIFGQRDREGNVKQVGIVDRIANIVAAKGLTMEDVMKAYKPRVYESTEARTGMSPKLNESQHEEEALNEESAAVQGTGTVASPGGSQSNVYDTEHEKRLAEQVPGYRERLEAERRTAEEPGQELIPAAQGEKVDERIAEREQGNSEYRAAERWWEQERDNAPQVPKFEDLSDRHQEEVIDAVKRGEANGRLQKRVIAEFNEPSFYNEGKPFADVEQLKKSTGVRYALSQIKNAGLGKLKLAGIRVRAWVGGSGRLARQNDGTYIIYLQQAMLEKGDNAFTSHIVRHEMAHLLDLTVGGYSQSSQFSALMPKLQQLFEDNWGDGYLNYPFGPRYGHMNEVRRLAEAFAQVHSLWLDRPDIIQRDAPELATFLRQVDYHAKTRLAAGNAGTNGPAEAGASARGLTGNVEALLREVQSTYRPADTKEAAQTQGLMSAGKSFDDFKAALKQMPDQELTDTVQILREAREKHPTKQNTDRWLAAVAEVNARDKARLFQDVNDRFGGEPPSGLHAEGKAFQELERAQQEATTRLGDLWAKYKPTILTLHQLTDQFGDKLASLKNYVLSTDKMEQRHHEVLNRAHKVMLDWQGLGTRERQALDQVMYRATLRGVHPDEPFGTGGNDHLTDPTEHEALQKRYDALSPAAKDVYKAVRKMLDDNWAARKAAFAKSTAAAYQKLIDDAAGDPKKVAELEKDRDRMIADHARTISELKGPYFPLLRMGDYLTIAKSKAYADVERQLEDATGTERTQLQARLKAMQKQAEHYTVEAHENRFDAEQSAAQYSARGMDAKAQLAEQHLRQLQPLAAGSIDRITSAMADQFDRDTARQLKQALTEVYISSLPEHAALQRQLKRKGVEGANQDMLRSVAKAIEKDAFYLARLEYADEISDNLFKVKLEAKKAGIDAQHVYNDLANRMALDFEWKPTPVQSVLARLSGVWHLGMSPAYLLTNATQPWMITAPVLAGRFGAGRTFSAMRDAWVDAARIIKQSKAAGAFADIDFKGIADAQERDMLERIVSRGQVDITQNVDMGLIADGANPHRLKLQKVINWANQHIEVSNRVTTALAAYRLARQRGMSHDDAAEFAFKVVVDTQLDYSNANAAYWMKTGAVPLGKLIFQFRKYQQGMLYLMARNAQLAFRGDKDAMKALGYMAAMQLAFAGATGIPVVMAPLAALGLFWPDDDEKGDPETQLRNYLSDMMGPDAARAFWKGLPTLVGLDVSQRVGMGDFWKPLPYLRLTGQTGSDDMAQLLLQTMGAPFGTLASFWDAEKFFEKGAWGKGIEKLLPKTLSDPLKAARYAGQGLTTRSGTQVLTPEKIDGWDVVFRAAGFSPTVETEHYEAQRAKQDTAQAIQDRRNTLLADYANARQRGESTSSALEAINRFNQDHAARGMRIDRSAMLKAAQSRRRGAKETDEAGVSFTKSQRPLRGIDRFAF